MTDDKVAILPRHAFEVLVKILEDISTASAGLTEQLALLEPHVDPVARRHISGSREFLETLGELLEHSRAFFEQI